MQPTCILLCGIGGKNKTDIASRLEVGLGQWRSLSGVAVLLFRYLMTLLTNCLSHDMTYLYTFDIFENMLVDV